MSSASAIAIIARYGFVMGVSLEQLHTVHLVLVDAPHVYGPLIGAVLQTKYSKSAIVRRKEEQHHSTKRVSLVNNLKVTRAGEQ